MNVINERTYFFEIWETISINIENIIVLISVFIVKRLNHELSFKRFFQRVARMNFVNIINKFFEIILYSLNEKKKINFLNVFVKHINNKSKKTIFTIKISNV